MRIGFVSLLACFLLAGTASTWAQQRTATTRPASLIAGPGRPTAEHFTQIDIKEGEDSVCQLDIHQDRSSEGRPNTFYIKPLWAVIEKAKPLHDGDLSAILQALDESNALRPRAMLKFRTTLDEMLRMSADAVRERMVQEGKEVKLQPIMEKWPVISVTVECWTEGKKQLLAVSQEQNNITNFVECWFEFTPDNYKLFLALSKEKKLEFYFYYTYENENTAVAVREVKGSFDVALTQAQQLAAKQGGTKGEVFQWDRDEICRRVSARLISATHANSSEALSALGPPSLAVRLFSEGPKLKFEDLERSPEKFDAFARALQPLIQNVITQKGTTSATASSKQDLAAKTREHSGSFGLSLGPINILGGDGGSDTNSVLQTIAEQTGITFSSTDVAHVYAPQTIQTFTVRMGAETSTIEETQAVYLSLGHENVLLRDGPIKSSFTEKFVKDHVAVAIQQQEDRLAKAVAMLEAEIANLRAYCDGQFKTLASVGEIRLIGIDGIAPDSSRWVEAKGGNWPEGTAPQIPLKLGATVPNWYDSGDPARPGVTFMTREPEMVGQADGTNSITPDGGHIHRKNPEDIAPMIGGLGYHMAEVPNHNHGGDKRPRHIGVRVFIRYR